MDKVLAELGKFEIENLPSISDTVPIVVPFTNIVAPTTGSLSSSERITPVTDVVWAVTKPAPVIRQTNNNFNLLFI
jgi:hypothetical protein